jgi:hypothetical protein
MVGQANRMRGLESRAVWRLNVWTREVAAGGTWNDGSFTPHSTHYVMGAECSAHFKDEKKVPVHVMKACGGSRDRAPLIHNLGIRWIRVLNLTLRMLYPGTH